LGGDPEMYFDSVRRWMGGRRIRLRVLRRSQSKNETADARR